MSASHLWVGLRYVEENPCHAGMVNRPELYRWSSAAAHLGAAPDRARILDLQYWERAGGAATWAAELHHRNLRREYVNWLRKCTYAGRPFGDDEFLTELETRFQRKWRRMPNTCFDSAAQNC
jgi:putative transposase